MSDEINNEQSSNYVLVYEIGPENDFNLATFNDQLKTRNTNFLSLTIYSSNCRVGEGIDPKKVVPSVNIYYYYHYIYPVSHRQKMETSKTTGKVVSPKYYTYAIDIYTSYAPSIAEKNIKVQDSNNIISVLKYLQSNNQATVISHYSRDPSSNPNNLEYHFWQIQKLDSLQSFHEYLKVNNIIYQLGVIISRFKYIYEYNKYTSLLIEDDILLNIPNFLTPLLTNNIVNKDLSKEPPIYTSVEKDSIASDDLKERAYLDKVEVPLESETIFDIDSITTALERDVYPPGMQRYIFSLDFLNNSKDLEEILNKKARSIRDLTGQNESNKRIDPKDVGLSEGYKFLFYFKKFIVVPYKSDRPQPKFVEIVYEYLPKEIQDKYQKYTKNIKK